MTCRARKVKCGEEKPVCTHCTRLRLRCKYTPAIVGSSLRRRDERPTVSSASGTTSQRPDANFFNTVLRFDEQQLLPETSFPSLVNGNAGQSSSSDLPDSFDMLGLIGAITSELQQKHFDLSNGRSDFMTLAAFPSLTDGSDAGPSQRQAMSNVGGPSSTGDASAVSSVHRDAGAGPSIVAIWPESRTAYEEQLLLHFTSIDEPPVIFSPCRMEWKYMKQAMVALLSESGSLLNAIYCFSDIHKAIADGNRWEAAHMYYQLASSEIQSCVLGDVTTPMLKKIFSAMLLLMLSELLSYPELCRLGTSHLHSAYLLLDRFYKQTQSWTGLSRLVISWVALLDVKSLVAGREGDPLVELGNVSESVIRHLEGDVSQSERPARASVNGNNFDDCFSSPSFLVYDAIVGPVFRFHSLTQQVIRRIVDMDLHHRSRGTLNDEFEVLQIAHKVGADLEMLWNFRPPVIDVYNRPDELLDTLNPSLAVEVCGTFRQYVANFLAIFIYLHRVAFAIYPRTDRVNGAVRKIIQLATIDSKDGRPIASGFLWPLFIAGLEASLEQRQWIMREIRQMVDQDCAILRHPNAEKLLLLLDEMTKRQDATRTWADSKCVRRELFPDFFVMI
ncbi:hypothetical protein MAP00_005466 [Monascus purpureus]|nr:hypothetical protein MAP00_005466 [Monascus purpureus]